MLKKTLSMRVFFMSKSNNNGRALEACLVQTLVNLNLEIELSTISQYAQNRDLKHLNNLTPSEYTLFKDGCTAYAKSLNHENIVLIERLEDSAAIKGDVTDIRITYKDKSIKNISVKNNHDASKHPRLGAFISQQLGLGKESNFHYSYIANLQIIEQNFYIQTLPNEVLFNIVKLRNEQIINNLYADIYNLTIKEINTHGHELAATQNYFLFLLGNHDFEKFKLNPNRTFTLQHFSSQNLPSSMTASLDQSTGYARVDFNNGFSFLMRIHTASSKFNPNSKARLSLKYDVSVLINPTYNPQIYNF